VVSQNDPRPQEAHRIPQKSSPRSPGAKSRGIPFIPLDQVSFYFFQQMVRAKPSEKTGGNHLNATTDPFFLHLQGTYFHSLFTTRVSGTWNPASSPHDIFN
jgi:hypothetical protein